MATNYQIKCGKCNCEYKPRLKYYSCEKGKEEQILNYACPQCGFGGNQQKDDKNKKEIFKERASSKKQLLLD